MKSIKVERRKMRGEKVDQLHRKNVINHRRLHHPREIMKKVDLWNEKIINRRIEREMDEMRVEIRKSEEVEKDDEFHRTPRTQKQIIENIMKDKEVDRMRNIESDIHLQTLMTLIEDTVQRKSQVKNIQSIAAKNILQMMSDSINESTKEVSTIVIDLKV